MNDDEPEDAAYDAVRLMFEDICDDESLNVAIDQIRTAAANPSLFNNFFIEHILRLAMIGVDKIDEDIELEEEGAALLKQFSQKRS